LLREGDAITIVSYGAGVHWALETLDIHKQVKADLLDLRTLAPLDMESIYKSVRKTGKLIILQEDSGFGGIASDISSLVMETCFEYLDGPIKRVASMETPIPFNAELERNYLAKSKFEEALLTLLAY
jgi:2-oxoisovalerate dehydrogenase E1 component